MHRDFFIWIFWNSPVKNASEGVRSIEVWVLVDGHFTKSRLYDHNAGSIS